MLNKWKIERLNVLEATPSRLLTFTLCSTSLPPHSFLTFFSLSCQTPRTFDPPAFHTSPWKRDRWLADVQPADDQQPECVETVFMWRLFLALTSFTALFLFTIYCLFQMFSLRSCLLSNVSIWSTKGPINKINRYNFHLAACFFGVMMSLIPQFFNF